MHPLWWLLAKKLKKQVFVRMWKIWDTCTLLVGTWNGETAVENSTEIPQKTKNRIIIWSSNLTSRYMHKKIVNRISKRYLCNHFKTALFTTVKRRKQPKHPQAKEWRKKMLYIHRMEYYSELKGSDVTTQIKFDDTM